MKKAQIKVFDDNGQIVLSGEYGDILLNDYLEDEGFYHLKKDIYTKEELDNITNLINDYNDIDKDNIDYIVDIATNWWLTYLMSPTLKDGSLLKIIFMLLVSWRTIYYYKKRIVNVEKLKRELKSRLKVELIREGEITISQDNDELLNKIFSPINCNDIIEEDIKMVINCNKILVWTDSQCQTLYYNYVKTKKK